MSNRNSFIESTKETDERLEALKQLYPEIFSDGKINLDAFKDVTGTSDLPEGQDRTPGYYGLYWPGKRAAKQLARKEAEGTLEPVPGDGINEDTTHNIYIEGDNLEVLRILKQSYKGRVKMIYIDPPYNTGNDFIYPDDFKMPVEEYLKMTGQADEGGKKLVTNLKSNGSFHTNWLNMMYPRLQLARELLTEDGVIFISIDENEQSNLKLLCDDVFGEENFVDCVSVKTKVGGVSGSSEGKSLKGATEYLFIYTRGRENFYLNPVYIKTKLFDRIKSYEIEGKSWKYTSVVTKLSDKELIKEDKQNNMKYYGYKVLETASITSFAKEKGITEEDVYNQYADKIFQTTNAQSSVRQTVIKETSKFDYPMYGLEYTPIKGKNEGNQIEILYKGEQRRMMMFLSDALENIDGTYYYLDKITNFWDDIDYNNLSKEGDVEFPNGKKPIKLLQRAIDLQTDKNCIVMDFFSGSASTAHAVMQQNFEDKGKRKFIMVQLPYNCEEDTNSAKVGFETICDIGKERIRRAGKQILDQAKANKDMFSEDNPLDVGFKVYRLQNSNFVKYTPVEGQNEDSQNKLFEEFEKNQIPLVQGWKAENVLTEIILKQGFALDCTKENVDSFKKNKIWKITDSADTVSKKIKLYVCLDNFIEEETIKNLTLNDDEKFICLDAAIDDSAYARLADKGRIETI